jgi:hypothetical protein
MLLSSPPFLFCFSLCGHPSLWLWVCYSFALWIFSSSLCFSLFPFCFVIFSCFFFLWLDRANQHRSSLLFSFFPLSIFFFFAFWVPSFSASLLFSLFFFSPSLVLAFRLAFIGPYYSSLRMVIL